MKIGKYRHYKGKEYEVLFVAKDSDTLSEMVVYKSCYHSLEFGKDAVWVREKSEFLEQINHNGKRVSRFEFIS